MKFLIVGAIYHPEELAHFVRHTTGQPGGQPAEPPLFPPSQEQFLWVRALRRLGHEVQAFIRNVPAFIGMRARRSQRFGGRTPGAIAAMLLSAFSSRAPRLQPDYYARNRRLLAQAQRFEPDALLIVGGNREIFPETLAQIKAKYGSTLLFLSGDSPVVFATALEKAAAPLYDVAVVNDFYHGIQWRELGTPRMEALPVSACDPEFHRPYALTGAEQAELGCEVGFVGTLMPLRLYSERVAALEAVRDCGLGVWSIHAVPDSLRAVYRGPALGERARRAICASKIQINPHGNFMRYGGNIRLFEVAGCGVFQLADDRPGVSVWFTPGQNIVTYRDPAHLRALAEYYLRHDDERRAIAQAAQAHVYAHHTYDHRMARLTEIVAALR